MTRHRRNGQPDIDEKIRQQQLRQILAQQPNPGAVNAKIEGFLLMTASSVYGHLAAAAIATRDPAIESPLDIDELRAIAEQSKFAALVLAESYGMVKVEAKPQPEPAAETPPEGPQETQGGIVIP